MEIGAKELYDAIQRMGAEFDTKWAELDQKISAHMQSFGPELAKLDWRVTQIEKAREKDAQHRQWSTGMKVTVTGLVLSVGLSLVLGVLSLTTGG